MYKLDKKTNFMRVSSFQMGHTVSMTRLCVFNDYLFIYFIDFKFTLK